jgi:hypothetical protein
MKKVYFCLLLAGLFILSCSRDTDPSSVSIYGKWMLVSRENYSTSQVFYKDPNDVQGYCGAFIPCEVIITLAKVNGTNTLTGHTITNQVSGGFSFNPETREITIDGFGGTKVAEPDWSDNMWDNMPLIESYDVNSQFLRLYFDNKNQSLTFSRQ